MIQSAQTLQALPFIGELKIIIISLGNLKYKKAQLMQRERATAVHV